MVRRYRRYRRYKRTYYRRKKWTPYNSEVGVDTTATGTGNIVSIADGYYKETTNTAVFGSSNSIDGSAAPTNAVSAINYYVCRCRYKGVFNDALSAGFSYIVYLGFVPNAVDISQQAQPVTGLANTFFYRHPEYILAWTRLDNIAGTGDTGEISLYSRITKRIAPGDRVVIGVLSRNMSGDQAALAKLQGTFSCYLRTN